ncbi:thiol-disulfide oxidoreductase DCC family protein [Aquirhabdus parva]|uniref:Thiol-disulfide oxidoreductase DCC family protein n=1 Tax=Aquirhabdus parva TaxID=2283318 RepID=A0A345P6N7_9GAMM|nr:thiol-disulfide oxidoreductase DCC family protein [Aquirhabdus parva]AXI02946.1 thiol-disulfide oxidoreductase DCC family protein [Aquirhabdus parva]
MTDHISQTPPHMKANDKVILYDGVCKLCNAWSIFIIKYDRAHAFKLASVQSPEGQALLKYFNMPTTHFDTMLYIENNTAYSKSTAFLNIVRLLPTPFNLLKVLRFIPTPLRDWCYDRVALNRYRLFGKYDQCVAPSPEHQQRFL